MHRIPHEPSGCGASGTFWLLQCLAAFAACLRVSQTALGLRSEHKSGGVGSMIAT
jgi:hypothetical protein